MRETWMLTLALVGCGGGGPYVIEDPMPPQMAWADVTLTLMGEAANDDKVRICRDEARRLGIRMSPVSQMRGTLVLNDEGNRLQLPTGEQMLGKWKTESVCRVAVARAAGIDFHVQILQRTEPPGCRMLVPVTAVDEGYVAPWVGMVSGSYDAALVMAQVNTLRAGGNVLVVDSSVGAMNSTVSGRAFLCMPQQQQPPPQPAPQQQPVYTPPPPQ
jgi:hypothetical protein